MIFPPNKFGVYLSLYHILMEFKTCDQNKEFKHVTFSNPVTFLQWSRRDKNYKSARWTFVLPLTYFFYTSSGGGQVWVGLRRADVELVRPDDKLGGKSSFGRGVPLTAGTLFRVFSRLTRYLSHK